MKFGSSPSKNDFEISIYSLIITLTGISIHSLNSYNADLKIALETESILDNDQPIKLSLIFKSISFWFFVTPFKILI